MALKFMKTWEDGKIWGWSSWALQALEYAIQHGAKISSNSWGASYQLGQNWNNTLANNPQHLFVAAAGNQNRMIDEEDPFSSCSIIMPNVLCVANSNQYDSRSSSSNWGKDMVHVFAPGEHILSTYVDYQNYQYVYLTGTSMACPQVSGLAALILTMQKNLTGDELKSYIVQNVQKKAQYADLVSSGGLIDIVETIRAVKIESTLINLLFMKSVHKSIFF